ncbi:hypothetical protein ACROYT_G009252 [Oculina patagonica]
MASQFELTNLDLKTAFTRWISREGQKHLSILVTGRTGVGKSRLVNALVGKRVAEEGKQKGPETPTVNPYPIVINGIEVLVWDSPGLQDGTCDEEFYLEDMGNKLHKGLDIMLYCIKMDDMRFRGDDKNAIRALTRKFGPEIWKNAVIALTFANKIEDPDGEDDEEQKDYFLRDLKFWQDEIDQFLASDREVKLDSTIRKAIPLVPVGISKKPRLPTCENWLSDFWISCYRRMKSSSRINLYRISKNRCRFPSGSVNIEAPCSSEMQAAIAAEADDQIPDLIPLSQEQHDEFWKNTWDSFKVYCTEMLERPELVTTVGLAVLLGLLFSVKP